jgi:hypothetical protein
VRAGLLCAALLAAAALPSSAAVPGHYSPVVLNIRDYYLPDKGMYAGLYVPYYHAGEVHDASGDAVESLTVPTKLGPASVGVGASVDMVALAPTLVWATDLELIGARYGGLLAPTFANANQAAELETQTQLGASGRRSSFSLGDLFLEPVWLDWRAAPFEASLSYGLYMPTGKFNVKSTTLPNGAETRGPVAGSTGYGYWESQFQGSGAWYPWEDKRTAVSLTATYEIPGKQRNLDVSPGSYFTLVWGVSQFLPLQGRETLLELGPVVFGQWQLNRDSGDEVRFDALARALGAGVQLGVTSVPKRAAFNIRYIDEFRANSRFQGQLVSASLMAKLF